MFFAERVASRCRAPNRADDQADEKRKEKTGSDLHEARRSYVRFRNLLRLDPEEAARYEACKLQLAERSPTIGNATQRERTSSSRSCSANENPGAIRSGVSSTPDADDARRTL